MGEMTAFYALAAAACGGQGRPRSAVASPGPLCDYDVRVAPDLGLAVTATFGARVERPLAVDDAALPFVDDVALIGPAGTTAVARGDGGYAVDCDAPCRVEYHFALRGAAAALADVDTAIALGGAVVAPPSTWLLRPVDWSQGRYRFRVHTATGSRFATGVRPSAAAKDAYEGNLEDVEQSAFSAFGALSDFYVAPGVDVSVASGVRVANPQIVEWLRTELGAITSYLGRPPADRLTIIVAPGTSDVNRGKTLGGGGASILVRLGTATTPQALADDWVVAHELVHVGFPFLGYEHAWFSEGLATYVEPVARVRRGLLSVDEFWRELVAGLPQGLPEKGDRGLEAADAWGRVYWGGALYFLLADTQIRARTSGGRSLDDAVRAVAATGANVETQWPLERVLDVADRATGIRVFHELYAQYGTSPGVPDLAALWASLGVRQMQGSGSIQFDDGAPLSAIRRAITAAAAEPGASSVKNHVP
jgi:hypothetical protein